jgi:hypothetical protein
MTAIVLAILTALAVLAAVVRKLARRKVVMTIVKELQKIEDKAQKEIDAVPEVPKKFSREEVRDALRVIRRNGDK